MNKYTGLFKNTMLVLCGNAGCRMLQFFLLPYLTLWLMPAEYGIRELIAFYSAVLAGLFSFRMEHALLAYGTGAAPQERSGYFTAALGVILLQTLLWSAVLLILRRILAPENILVQYGPWLLGITLGNAVYLLLQEFCRAAGRMGLYSVSGVVYTGVMAAGTLLLLPGSRLSGLLTAVIGGYAAGIFVMTAALRPGTLFHWPVQWLKTLKKMLCFSLPVLPNGILWMIASMLNRPLLEHFHSLTAVGIFAMAGKIPLLLDSFWSVFFNAWQVSAVQEYTRPGFARYYSRIGRISWQLCLLAASVLTVGAVHYVPRFFCGGYQAVLPYIPLLLAGMVFSAFSGFFESVFTASGRSRYFFYSTSGAFVISLILNLLLIPPFGIPGAAAAADGTLLAQFLIRGYFVRRLVRLTGTGNAFAALAAFLVILLAFYGVKPGPGRIGIYTAAMAAQLFLLYRDLRVFLRLRQRRAR